MTVSRGLLRETARAEADHANLQLKIKESDVRYEAQVRQIKLDWERGAREIDARFEKRRADILSARDDPSIRAEIEMMLSQNRDTEIAALRRTCEEKFEEAERLHAEQKQRYESESFKLISAMMVSAPEPNSHPQTAFVARPPEPFQVGTVGSPLAVAQPTPSETAPRPLPTARVPLPSQRPPSLPIPIAPRNDARLGAPNRSPHNPAAGGQHPLMPQTIRQQFPATDNPREVGLSPTLQSVARRLASPSSDPGQENRSPQFATPARPDEQLSVPAHPSPRPESALKRKANGETSQQSPATQPGPLKRPKVEAPRGDRSETSDLSPPDVDESPTPERAVSFAEVYGTPEKPATYKHVIVRFPDNITGQFYILRCDGHGVHFGEHPLRGAAKHLASAQHNFMSKAHTTAIETLGHRVVGCTQEMAEKNNAVVLKAFQNGYKAFNANNLSQAKRAELGFPPPDPLNSHRAAMHRKQLAGATSPVPCRFYVTSDGDSKSLVLILPQGDISRAGLRGTLADTGLFPDVTDGGQSSGMQKPPRCYVYREVDGRIAGIKGWAKGYEDGGISERKREFPVLCVDDPDFRNWTVGWVKAGSLSAFDFDGTNSGDIPFAREARQYFVDRILRQSGGRHSYSSPQDTEMKDVGSDRDSDTDHASNRPQLIAAQALGLQPPKRGGFTAINAGGGDNASPSTRASLEPPSRAGSVPSAGAASRRVIKIHARSSNRHPANGSPTVVLPERPADGTPGPNDTPTEDRADIRRPSPASLQNIVQDFPSSTATPPRTASQSPKPASGRRPLPSGPARGPARGSPLFSTKLRQPPQEARADSAPAQPPQQSNTILEDIRQPGSVSALPGLSRDGSPHGSPQPDVATVSTHVPGTSPALSPAPAAESTSEVVTAPASTAASGPEATPKPATQYAERHEQTLPPIQLPSAATALPGILRLNTTPLATPKTSANNTRANSPVFGQQTKTDSPLMTGSSFGGKPETPTLTPTLLQAPASAFVPTMDVWELVGLMDGDKEVFRSSGQGQTLRLIDDHLSGSLTTPADAPVTVKIDLKKVRSAQRTSAQNGAVCVVDLTCDVDDGNEQGGKTQVYTLVFDKAKSGGRGVEIGTLHARRLCRRLKHWNGAVEVPNISFSVESIKWQFADQTPTPSSAVPSPGIAAELK
ncbi:uncharacterized protein C8A04DRAFT_10544 [Dichotomopilus funicola]|uniref:Uncharacterized protein n=1 Tax=Dichotomopilus funicola TaxID=1934379 RepID=A0AAN6ZQN3_9PEZI|nr:hypothetical protein C8A04DRAFT_10544 [Dichotomopilus funicola]